jgi:predicted alpha/beta hydrolase family esterase
MSKRVFIIHGWDGYPEEGWFPWLKRELEFRGFEVQVPAMPDPSEPIIDVWVPHLAKLVGEPDEQTFFVGHSIGCQTILRYLQTFGQGKKVGGAVFVAGWFVLSDLESEEEKIIGKPWIEMPIDFAKVKSISKNFVAIFGDNDPVVPYEENRKLFEERLNARIIVEHSKGHFSGSDGVTELPSVLEAILEMAK